MRKLVVFFTLILLVSCKKEKLEPTSLCSIRVTKWDNTQEVKLGNMTSKEIQNYMSSSYKTFELYCNNGTIKGNK